MKKTTTLFLLAGLLSLPIFSQNLTNPSFDSVRIGAIDRIYNWITSDGFFFLAGNNGDTIPPLEPNEVYPGGSEMVFNVQGDWSGTLSPAAILLQNQTNYLRENGAPFETFITNGNQFVTGDDGYIDFSKGGSPFPHRPSAMRFFFRMMNDTSSIDFCGEVIILLKKYNSALNKIDTISRTNQLLNCGPSGSPWAPIEIPLQYQSTETPDSIVVLFNIYNTATMEGTTSFFIDEISFTYFPATGVNESEEIPSVIYPNPNSGSVYISGNSGHLKSYYLLDLTGKKIKSGDFNEYIRMEDVPDGMYILRLVDLNGKTSEHRLLKQD